MFCMVPTAEEIRRWKQQVNKLQGKKRDERHVLSTVIVKEVMNVVWSRKTLMKSRI